MVIRHIDKQVFFAIVPLLNTTNVLFHNHILTNNVTYYNQICPKFYFQNTISLFLSVYQGAVFKAIIFV